jgi:hypothetical protein
MQGLVGQHISQEKTVRVVRCDAFGESMVKATLQDSGWTYHHDGINQQFHKITKQSSMANLMEIGHYFMRKLQEMVVPKETNGPLLSKHMWGYIPDGQQKGIACNQFPA